MREMKLDSLTTLIVNDRVMADAVTHQNPTGRVGVGVMLRSESFSCHGDSDVRTWTAQGATLGEALRRLATQPIGQEFWRKVTAYAAMADFCEADREAAIAACFERNSDDELEELKDLRTRNKELKAHIKTLQIEIGSMLRRG